MAIKNNVSYSIGVSTTTLMRPIIDGIGHYTQQLINNLTAFNIRCKGFSFCQQPNNQPQISSVQENIIFPHRYIYYIARSMVTGKKMFRFNPGVDLFHCTDYRLIPMSCPTITTLHDAIPILHPEWSGRGIRSLLASYCIRRSAKFADHVVTVSHHAAQDIIRYFKINEKNISVVYNSIDDRWFAPIDKQYTDMVLNRYLLPQEYFLSVGTIQPRKNFAKLIDAYFLLPASIRQEKKLVIVGKYGWNCEQLAQRMRLLQKEGSLIWLSNVDFDEDLRAIYQMACAFIFPSLYEGFGIPIIEAFASKIPVVCSNTTSLPEVANGAALEVNPDSVGELAEAMQLLATNSSVREKLIALGNMQVEQFKWQAIAQQTIAVYKKLLS